MKDKLLNKKVAILATDGFEESELFVPLEALKEAGAEVQIISLKAGKIKGWKDNNWSKEIKVDLTFDQAKADDYDGIMLPGGVINADKLRAEKAAVNFVEDFVLTSRPVAAICHAAWILIEADAVHGRTMTSWPSLKTDLYNAGATWVNKEVVTEQGWVTSRCPDDLPSFCKKMIEEIAEGRHGAARGMAQESHDEDEENLHH